MIYRQWKARDRGKRERERGGGRERERERQTERESLEPYITKGEASYKSGRKGRAQAGS